MSGRISFAGGDQIKAKIDDLRNKYGDRKPSGPRPPPKPGLADTKKNKPHGTTLERLQMGGTPLEQYDVPLADKEIAHGRARARRPYADIRAERPLGEEGFKKTKLLIESSKTTCYIKPLPFWSVKIHKLAEFGIGLELYFWQAVTLAIVLVIMGAVSFPNLWFNVEAAKKHYADGEDVAPLSAVTLGMRTEPFPVFTCGMYEVIATAIFAGYLVWLRWWNTVVAAHNNKRYTTSADYTVQVTKLPPLVEKEELRRYFELPGRGKQGGIVHIELPTQNTVELAEVAVQFAETWRDAVEAKARQEQDLQRRPISEAGCSGLWAAISRLPWIGWDRLPYDKLKSTLQTQRNTLKNEYAEDQADKHGTCGTAFVTFSRSADAQAAVRQGRYRGRSEMFLHELRAKAQKSYQQPKSIRGITPEVTRASEATDVRWENLRYQVKCNGFFSPAMQWVTNVLLILLIGPVFQVVFTLTRYKLELAGELEHKDGDDLKFDMAIRSLLDMLLGISETWLGSWKVTSLTLLIAVFVSGANFALRELLYWVATFERSATSTEQQKRLFTLATLVYLAQYLNLFFVYSELTYNTLKNAHVDTDALLSGMGPMQHELLSHVHSAHWYGPSGLLPQVLATAITDGGMLVFNELAIVLPFLIRRKMMGSVQVSQARMDFFYDPPQVNKLPPCPSPNPRLHPPSHPQQFEVAKRYTYLVANAAIVIMYGPASPLMYLIGAGALTLMLVVQKLLFVQVYRRPRLIDDAIAERSRELLGVVLLVHVLFSANFYLVSARDSHSEERGTHAWPLYVGCIVYLVYAIFPFDSLIKRTSQAEDWGATEPYENVASRMDEYRCVYTADAAMRKRIANAGIGKTEDTTDELPGYLDGFFTALCCPCAKKGALVREASML